MLAIDGSGGGGQLLRTALGLSVVTETPFEIEDVRGSRPNPGLRPQHLAAVRLVAELCDADVEGADLESDSLVFEPGETRRTALEADVGTAGSVTLLFDTVLPIAATMDEPLEVAATGGTDVKWAPTLAYLRRVKLALLARWGVDAAVDLERTGFYPAGGGKATLSARPSPPARLALEDRGDLERVEVYSKAADSLEERDVADRQADTAAELLADAGYPAETEQVAYVPSDSPGSSLLLRGVYEESLAGFDALGEPGRPSEDVAADAVEQFAGFHATDAPVDEHLADQLIAFLALAGGRVRIPRVTAHVETNLELVGAFGSDVELVREEGRVALSATAHPALG